MLLSVYISSTSNICYSNIRCNLATPSLSVSQSSLPRVGVLFSLFTVMRKMHVCRFCFAPTQHDVAVLLCEWASSAYGISALLPRLSIRTLQSQLPSLNVYQTQQIKNATDQCQSSTNNLSSPAQIVHLFSLLLSCL